jgi:hypothetical protein
VELRQIDAEYIGIIVAGKLRVILAKDPASAIRGHIVQRHKMFIINLSCDAATSKIAVRGFPTLKTGVMIRATAVASSDLLSDHRSTPHSQPA